MSANDLNNPVWRILVILGRSASSDNNLIPSVDISIDLADAPNCLVHKLEAPTLADIHQAMHDFQPNILYVWSGCTGHPDACTSPLQSLVLEGQDELLFEDLPELVTGRNIHALVLNMSSEIVPSSELRQHVPHVARWGPDHEVSALNAASFAHTLFSLLRLSCISFTEAFAMATHITRAHACADTGAKRDPVYPILDSSEPVEMPGVKPNPIPQVEGVDLSLGMSRSVQGWEDTRLLSPIAEVTLQLVATPCILDTDRLAALGLALRSLCCLEARQARLLSTSPLADTPQHVVPGTSVACIITETTSGVRFPIVMGAPAQVMQTPGLLEAAVQATLTSDAISLRFMLPPHGATAPDTIEDANIARGTKCTPVVTTTSVWVVHVLRTIARQPENRLLSLLGIGAVSQQPVLGYTDADLLRYQMLQTQQPLLVSIPQVNFNRFNMTSGPPPLPWDMNADMPTLKMDKAKNKFDRGATLRETKFDELTANAAPVEQWQSHRPPLPQCTQQVFMNDLISFLTNRFGWTIHASDFPNAVLNGVPLDLFNLYRSVVARGGFKMGNAINWKGEIFTKMANWTADHKMTGVGNALKRHYRKLLWEYERANQRDIAGDKCMLCQGGPESGTDWVACGQCHRWQHIACDPRSGLGDLKQFADSGRVFSCVDCSKIKAEQQQQQLQPVAPLDTTAPTDVVDNMGMPPHIVGDIGAAGIPPDSVGVVSELSAEQSAAMHLAAQQQQQLLRQQQLQQMQAGQPPTAAVMHQPPQTM